MNIPNTTNTVRINITIPKHILTVLEKELPLRKKSGFISEAIEEKIARDRQKKALKDLAGLPPTFKNISDGKKYIDQTRREENEERNKRLGI
jgi:hypothetical protein